jgi:hypothetical protein
MKETANIGDWVVDLNLDDDGHLTVGINHGDGTKVICIEPGMLESNDQEWVDRFTTEGIEKAYQTEQKEDDDEDVDFEKVVVPSNN